MALGGVCRLVSLVHRRRTGKSVGGISGYTLFCCRDDRHNISGIPLWSRLLKLSSYCLVVLCLCVFLSGGSDLPHYSSIEGQMGCLDRKSTRLNSSHSQISYAVFCLKKKKTHYHISYLYEYCINLR